MSDAKNIMTKAELEAKLQALSAERNALQAKVTELGGSDEKKTSNEDFNGPKMEETIFEEECSPLPSEIHHLVVVKRGDFLKAIPFNKSNAMLKPWFDIGITDSYKLRPGATLKPSAWECYEKASGFWGIKRV